MWASWSFFEVSSVWKGDKNTAGMGGNQIIVIRRQLPLYMCLENLSFMFCFAYDCIFKCCYTMSFFPIVCMYYLTWTGLHEGSSCKCCIGMWKVCLVDSPQFLCFLLNSLLCNCVLLSLFSWWVETGKSMESFVVLTECIWFWFSWSGCNMWSG